MAIYHCSVKPVQRSSGRSSVAAAAYRSRSKIRDDRQKKTHDYSKRPTPDLKHSAIIGWSGSRAELWNAAESAERRKDATTAREYELALPVELDESQQIAVAEAYAAYLHDRHGCAVDVCIHDKGVGNPHAHLLTTTRPTIDQGTALAPIKCEREWSDKKRKDHDLPGRKVELEADRQAWATICNEHLAAAGIRDRIDHRTLEAQGIDRQPTVHHGPKAAAIWRRDPDASYMINHNNAIYDQRNQLAYDTAIAYDQAQPEPWERHDTEDLPELITPKPTPAPVAKPKPEPELEPEPPRPKTYEELQAELARLQEQYRQRQQIEDRLAEPVPTKRELVDKQLGYLARNASDAVYDAERAVHDADYAYRSAEQRYDKLSWFKQQFSIKERRLFAAAADRLEAAEDRLAKAQRHEKQERKRQHSDAVAAGTAEWKDGQRERQRLEKRRDQLPTAEDVQLQQKTLQQHPEYQRLLQERQRREEQERQEQERSASRRPRSPRPR